MNKPTMYIDDLEAHHKQHQTNPFATAWSTRLDEAITLMKKNGYDKSLTATKRLQARRVHNMLLVEKEARDVVAKKHFGHYTEEQLYARWDILVMMYNSTKDQKEKRRIEINQVILHHEMMKRQNVTEDTSSCSDLEEQ